MAIGQVPLFILILKKKLTFGERGNIMILNPSIHNWVMSFHLYMSSLISFSNAFYQQFPMLVYFVLFVGFIPSYMVFLMDLQIIFLKSNFKMFWITIYFCILSFYSTKLINSLVVVIFNSIIYQHFILLVLWDDTVGFSMYICTLFESSGLL